MTLALFGRWESLEQIRYGLFQLLFVLLRIAGQRIAASSVPDDLLGLRIEDIDMERAHGRALNGGGGPSIADAPTSVAPASAKTPVVPGFQRSLRVSRADG